jgi:WD40 repeat protein
LSSEKTLLHHNDSVYDVVFTSSGDRFASCSRDGEVIVWSIDGEIVRRWQLEPFVVSLCVSTDGDLVFAGATSGRVAVWSVALNELVCDLNVDQLERIALSHDEKHLFVGSAAGSVLSIDLASNNIQEVVNITAVVSFHWNYQTMDLLL